MLDEDRFDPYAPPVKRRAGSPLYASRRDSFGMYPISPITIPRSPMLNCRPSFPDSQSSSPVGQPPPYLNATSLQSLQTPTSLYGPSFNISNGSYMRDNSLNINTNTTTQNGFGYGSTISASGGNGVTIHSMHTRSGSFSMASSVASSPTIRSASGSMMLASPILRPVSRITVGNKRRNGEIEGEREVEDAGDGVGSLMLA